LLELEDPIFEFNKAIIDATRFMPTNPILLSLKPMESKDGWLYKTINYINDNYPIFYHCCDAKRGDIGNTSSMYAKAFFEDLNFDSVTVAPYMGKDSVEPFSFRKQTYYHGFDVK
jgi:orotidine-5'-phosphate decarboxylase